MTDEGFEEFYMAQWRPLMAMLTLALPAGEDPRDVAQEAFARAYARWDKVRAHERPDAWVFLTAFRLASRVRRKARRTIAAPVRRDVSLSDLVVESLSLRRDLLGLPAQQRAALLLRHYYGLTTRETAEALGCAEGTVKSLLARSRAALIALDAAGEA